MDGVPGYSDQGTAVALGLTERHLQKKSPPTTIGSSAGFVMGGQRSDDVVGLLLMLVQVEAHLLGFSSHPHANQFVSDDEGNG